jgi:hypothetical protein
MNIVKLGITKLITCRRSIIALTGIAACVIITKLTGTDTSGSISLIVTSVAGANAAQAVMASRKNNE